MGNPHENALPGCQIVKVDKLIANLQRAVEGDPSPPPDKIYRMWIDPLLCPVELKPKILSLERIADVYEQATCVLVLDASLMQYSTTEMDAAEILLRIFSTSAWMRRLWTLQGKANTCYPPNLPYRPLFCAQSVLY
jgi:hypothetical protein